MSHLGACEKGRNRKNKTPKLCCTLRNFKEKACLEKVASMRQSTYYVVGAQLQIGGFYYENCTYKIA
jgi:hypothetical protein